MRWNTRLHDNNTITDDDDDDNDDDDDWTFVEWSHGESDASDSEAAGTSLDTLSLSILYLIKIKHCDSWLSQSSLDAGNYVCWPSFLFLFAECMEKQQFGLVL
jgi:hypothetical protein